MTGGGGHKAAPNVLISSAGRRVSLLRAFQEIVHPLGAKVVATDMSRYAPALNAADCAKIVPSISSPEFIPALLEVVVANGVTLLVPTLDTELVVLASHKKIFADAGCVVAVADPDPIAICEDKSVTFEWLVANNIPTVRQAKPEEVGQTSKDWPWPLISKPATGSASEGVRVLEGPPDLALCEAGDIVQTIATGDELTVDVYVDISGRARMAIPRKRLEVRAGEVSKAVTVHHEAAEVLSMRIAELLPGAFGAVTVQLFADGQDLRVIEINPRFGGGFPLSWHAGGRFPEWMVAEVAGISPVVGPWVRGLCMMRYDGEIIALDSDLP